MYSYYTYNTSDWGPFVGMAAGTVLFVLLFAAIVGLLLNMLLTWGVYKKGGYKGWEGVVPFYSNYCLVKMADLEMVWFVLSIFLPVVNIYIYIKLAEKFGKSAVWGVGLFFLGVVFFPMLGYGSAQYQGKKPAAEAKTVESKSEEK